MPEETPEFMVKLEELRKKQIEELTEEEIGFLKARRSYLRPDEVKYFGLEEGIAEAQADGEAESVGTAKPAKRKKAAEAQAE